MDVDVVDDDRKEECLNQRISRVLIQHQPHFENTEGSQETESARERQIERCWPEDTVAKEALRIQQQDEVGYPTGWVRYQDEESLKEGKASRPRRERKCKAGVS